MDYIDNCITIISECNSCIESCDENMTSKELYKVHDLCNKIANTTYNKNGVIPEVESTRIKIIMKISQSLVYMFSRITDNIIDMVDARSMVKSPIIDVDLQTYGKVM